MVGTSRRFDWGARTYLFGVLNVTPDSFSADGLAGDVAVAVERAQRMREEGADIIDVGGESTRPGHMPVTAEEELRRVEPVVRALVERGIPVSIDTRKASVARRALALGAEVVNDVSGMSDAEMGAVLAANDCLVVLMDDADVRGQRDPMGAVRANLASLVERAERLGIARSRLVLDPGFGFGKGPRENLAVLRELARLRDLGLPLLLGTSRKSTIGVVLGGLPVEERLEGTAATVALAIANGADAVRVHDVKEMARVARMADAVVRGWRESMARAYIGLGSNLGDRARTLRDAVAELGRSGARVVAVSSLYETAPWGESRQPMFLNAACAIETELQPEALLATLHEIERRFGRDRAHEVRWGPRTLDLDLLLYDGRVLRTESLTLPHPHLHERAFALQALAEIAPDLRHPVLGKTIAELAAEVGSMGVRRLPVGRPTA